MKTFRQTFRQGLLWILLCVACLRRKGNRKRTKSCELSVSDTEQNIKGVLTPLIQSKRTQSQKPEGTKQAPTHQLRSDREREKAKPREKMKNNTFRHFSQVRSILVSSLQAKQKWKKKKTASINSLKAHFASTQTFFFLLFFTFYVWKVFFSSMKMSEATPNLCRCTYINIHPRLPLSSLLRIGSGGVIQFFHLAFEESGGSLSGVCDR